MLIAARAQSKPSSSAPKTAETAPNTPLDTQDGWLFPTSPISATNAPEILISRRIFTVQSLVGEARQLIENRYADVWVEGEISNLRPAASGHIYFTIKDLDAQLSVVMFRRQSSLLRFMPQDGMAVLARGKVSIYENRGQLQLVADLLEPLGAGALQIAFEQLKARLTAEGLFATERKRPLPPYPTTIGILTSPTGAVIQDLLNILNRRHSRLNILLYPVVVQGQNTAQEVMEGIEYFNSQTAEEKPLVDIIIIARGGGSIEDFAGFNDESVARAIAASQIPIVSAIGHETDFTIADFAADLRAPTPSAAAELVTSAQHVIDQHLDELTQRVLRACRYQLMRARERYNQLSASAVLARVENSLGRRLQRLDDLHFRLQSAIERLLREQFRSATLLRERIMRQDVSHRLAQVHARLDRVSTRLAQAPQIHLRTHRTHLVSARARLESLSPLAVLGRGYALIFDAHDRLLTHAAATAPGENIIARLGHGSLSATVQAIKEENN